MAPYPAGCDGATRFIAVAAVTATSATPAKAMILNLKSAMDEQTSNRTHPAAYAAISGCMRAAITRLPPQSAMLFKGNLPVRLKLEIRSIAPTSANTLHGVEMVRAVTYGS